MIPELAPSSPAPAGGAPPASRSVAEAVALALVPEGTGVSRLRLRICGTARETNRPEGDVATTTETSFSLPALLNTLADTTAAPAGCWRLPCGWVALESADAGAEN